MQRYPNALCVAGTHGKTTTTSMCTHIFMAAEADPTVMIGGTLPLLHAGYRVGQGDTIILESCEYCNSFLSFFPTVAVILNVEEDHLDFFKDLADIQHSFRRFAELVPPAGSVIVNADNASAMEAVAGLEHPIFTFGLDHAADCTAANLTEVDGRPVFDVMIRGEKYARVELHVYGHHNVLNALAAASAAWALGLPGHAVETGLASFTGAGRRFEHKGTYHGAEVYDDYAHHPDELHALFTTAKEMGYERLVVAFQPHRQAVRAVRGRAENPGRGHPGGDLRRPGAEHLGHLLGGPVPQYPRRCVLFHPGQGGGGSAAGGPARRLDPHRRRR